MSHVLARSRWSLVGLLVACGGAPQAGPEPPGAAAARSRESSNASPLAAAPEHPSEGDSSPPRAGEAGGAPSETAGLPAECTSVGGLCLPPRAFVKRLCQDAYTGAALRLFDKSSPFTRGYVRSREVRAVNTLGGPSSDQSLRFDEEVLILTHSGGPGANEMQVSGMGGYEVLRWDGTCATLSDGELGTRAPRSPRHASVVWKYIDTNIQAALMQDAGIEAARRQHRKHCHGVSLGRISAECAEAEELLSARIVDAVRAGISLPTPERMP